MSPNGGAPCSNRRPKFFAMKKAQSDLDVECDFSDLPPAEREAACKYEYMRESRALRSLRSAVKDNLDKEFRHPHRRRIAPYLNRLSRLCTADCPRQYGFWRSEYRIYCSHCKNAVELPCDDWVKKLFAAARRHNARSVESVLKRKKKRASALPSFTPAERHKLVLALLK